MSNKDFSRKTMVSKETVVFYRMMANFEEKTYIFLFVSLIYVIMNIIKGYGKLGSKSP